MIKTFRDAEIQVQNITDRLYKLEKNQPTPSDSLTAAAVRKIVQDYISKLPTPSATQSNEFERILIRSSISGVNQPSVTFDNIGLTKALISVIDNTAPRLDIYVNQYYDGAAWHQYNNTYTSSRITLRENTTTGTARAFSVFGIPPAGAEVLLINIDGDGNLSPGTDNTQELGIIVTKTWKNIYQKQWTIGSPLAPVTDNATDIGDSTHQVRKLYLVNAQISGTATTLTGLTASRPLKLDASKNIISALISLTSANDITGTLPVGNGGTGQTTLGANEVLIGNGTSGITSIAGFSGSPAVIFNVTPVTTTIQYKDWSGTNQSATVMTGVTLTNTTFTISNGVVTSVV